MAFTLVSWLVINFAWGILPEFVLKVAQDPSLLEQPEAKQCGDCHKAIFEAWQKSRHSQAWISKTYIKASEDRTKEKCLNCHIPTEVRPGEKPDPRLNQRDEGIFCVSCHVKDGAMHGPHDLLAPPHPTRQDREYNGSRFCGSCHEKTFKQWQLTEERDTCQSCHMPRTRKRLTQKPPLSWLHLKKWVGDHRFLHGDFEPGTPAVQFTFTKSHAVVTLENNTIPHDVPTADNGDPRLFLEVTLIDDQGEQWDRVKEILAPQQETALAYKKEKVFRYRVPESVREARVIMRYQPAWSKEREDIYSNSFTRNRTG